MFNFAVMSPNFFSNDKKSTIQFELKEVQVKIANIQISMPDLFTSQNRRAHILYSTQLRIYSTLNSCLQ